MTEPTPFFSAAWAEAARAAVDAGPDDETRASKLEEYWAFIDKTRARCDATWALGVRDLPSALGPAPAYLLLRWSGGRCVEGRVVGPDTPLDATYVLAGDYADWVALLAGYDAGRTVMYRRLLLEEGPLLAFFRGIYFFVESLACIARVPTTLPGPSDGTRVLAGGGQPRT